MAFGQAGQLAAIASSNAAAELERRRRIDDAIDDALGENEYVDDSGESDLEQ